MNQVKMLTACGALVVAFLGAPRANAQRVGDGEGGNNQRGNPTRTQTIQDCEQATNQSGGNPGRTSGNTNNQNPWTHPTMTPPTRLLPGNYTVWSAAMSGTGDTKASSANIYSSNGNVVVQTPGGQSNLAYVCTGRSGMVYYRYGNQGNVVGFNHLPGTPGPFVYDVWWLGRGPNGTNAIESWNYEGPTSR